MTATGCILLRPHLEGGGALVDQHLDAAEGGRHPALAASRNRGVSSGLYTRSLTRTDDGMSVADSGVPFSSGPCTIPMEVQLTMRATSRAAWGAPDSSMASEAAPLSMAIAASRSARSRVRLAMKDLGNAQSAPGRRPRPGPSRRRRAPARRAREARNPPPLARARRNPMPSVLWPVNRPSRLTMVLTAPAVEAQSSTWSRKG